MSSPVTRDIEPASAPQGLRSKMVLPGDPLYHSLRHTYAYTGAPAAILLCETDDDVSAALTFARSQDRPISVRSGGHGISSRSTNDGGVIIDLSRLNRVDVLDQDAGRVRIQAGARWGAVARSLSPHGLAISSGDSGDVGVGGLATTGGVGLMARKFGLTIDHLRAATIVIADGSIVEVNDRHEPDLFWAIRGAGANFGIVTSFEFAAAHVENVVHAHLTYDATDSSQFLAGWGELMESAPRELTGFLYMFPGARGTAPSAMASIVYVGADDKQAQTTIEPFVTLAPALRAQASRVPYASAVATTGEAHVGQAPSDARTALLTHLGSGASEALAAILTSGAALTLQIRAVGGAVNDVGAAATAYAHRHQNFSVMAATVPALRGPLWQRWETLAPFADGIYLSFETDTDPQRLSEAFPDETLTRLREAKRRYDPDGIFNQNFAID